MPLKPARPCTHPGCGALAKGGKCDRHRTAYEQQRGSASSRGYDARWRKARADFLADNPLCKTCGEQGRIVAATEVDHKIPHRGDPALFWDRGNNWQALCKPCHAAKTWRGE